MYRIQKVDGFHEDVAEEIKVLHKATFADCAPNMRDVDCEEAYWWLVYHGKDAVGFAGMTVTHEGNRGYLYRSGVLPDHRGHGLQVRLIRAREAQARRNGWEACVSDTTFNTASANSLIKAGYRLYTPDNLWAFPHSLYWKRNLN